MQGYKSWSRDHALFNTKEQGTSFEIDKGAGSRQIVILEQEAQKCKKGAWSRPGEQRKMLKRSIEPENQNEKRAGSRENQTRTKEKH